MIKIEIPGFNDVEIRHIVLDFNGTLGIDGKMLSGVKEMLNYLATKAEVFIITADTFGLARMQCEGLNATLQIIAENNQGYTKQQFVRQLGSTYTVAIGNGRNDAQMLSEAIIGIAIVQREGASLAALQAGDIVCTSILDALELLDNPLRLKATLRN